MGLEFWKWRPYKVRSLVSNSIYAKKDRNGPPGANQGLSTTKPRHGHAVCTLGFTDPPLPVRPTLNLPPKDIAGSDIMKLKVSRSMDICAMGPKEFKHHHTCCVHNNDTIRHERISLQKEQLRDASNSCATVEWRCL